MSAPSYAPNFLIGDREFADGGWAQHHHWGSAVAPLLASDLRIVGSLDPMTGDQLLPTILGHLVA